MLINIGKIYFLIFAEQYCSVISRNNLAVLMCSMRFGKYIWSQCVEESLSKRFCYSNFDVPSSWQKSEVMGSVLGDATRSSPGGDLDRPATDIPGSPMSTASQPRPASLSSPNGRQDSPDRSRQGIIQNELISLTLNLLSRRVRDLRRRQEDELRPAISTITQSTREWRSKYCFWPSKLSEVSSFKSNNSP